MTYNAYNRLWISNLTEGERSRKSENKLTAYIMFEDLS